MAQLGNKLYKLIFGHNHTKSPISFLNIIGSTQRPQTTESLHQNEKMRSSSQTNNQGKQELEKCNVGMGKNPCLSGFSWQNNQNI